MRFGCKSASGRSEPRLGAVVLRGEIPHLVADFSSAAVLHAAAFHRAGLRRRGPPAGALRAAVERASTG